MNIQDLLQKTGEINPSKIKKKLEGYSKSIDGLADALVEIKGIFQNAGADFAEFYNKFHEANLPILLGSALAVYISKKIRNSPISDVADLPQKVSSFIKENKINPRVVELFFAYSQLDEDSYKMPIADVAGQMNKFDLAMKRLKRFFEKRTPVYVYKMLIATKNFSYKNDWDAMIEDLERQLTESDEDEYELKRSIMQCRIIQRYERQENINLTYLSMIFDKVCDVLDLEHSVELFNALRAVSLPPDITNAMGEYFTERARSLNQKDIDELVSFVRSRLEAEEYNPQNVELFFLAASIKPEYQNLSLSEIPPRLDRFDTAVKEINLLVESNPEYKQCVRERNNTYRCSWSRMIRYLKLQIENEGRKPDASVEVMKQLEAKVGACQAIVEIEEKGCLSPVSKRLYRIK